MSDAEMDKVTAGAPIDGGGLATADSALKNDDLLRRMTWTCVFPKKHPVGWISGAALAQDSDKSSCAS
jgi:hypothetical protein